MRAESAIQPAPTPVGIWVQWPQHPTNLDLRDVYFYSREQGWAVGGKDVVGAGGDSSVILSYSEGQWWIDESLPAAMQTNIRFNAINGTGPDNLWVAGATFRRELSDQEIVALFHFDGTAWQSIAIPNQSIVAPLTDVEVVETDAGYEVWVISTANARHTSYISHFDGVQWDQESIQNRSLLGMHMLNAGEGQAVSAGAGGAPDGHHYWYHDGFWQGTSVWTPQPLNAVAMAEPRYGWAVGNRGATDEYAGQCHTPGIGCSWYARQAVRSEHGRMINPNLWDIELLSHSEGWLVGEPWNGRSSVAYLTREPSPKWRLVPVVNDPGKALYGLTLLAGPDGHAVEGWAIGASGTILHYTVPLSEVTTTLTPAATVTATVTLVGTATRTPASTAEITTTPTPSKIPGASPTKSTPTPDGTPISVATPGVTATVPTTPASPTFQQRNFLPLIVRRQR